MTGKTQHDSETLATGQQVITAVALIHHDFDGVTKVFMPRRAATKKFLPDVFELVGGHVDYGEDPVAGLKREAFEEIGMRISVGDPFGCFTYTNEIKQSHSIEVLYFAEFLDPIEQIKLDPADHSEYAWVSEAELESIYTQNKGADDAESKQIRRGFELLAGARLKVS